MHDDVAITVNADQNICKYCMQSAAESGSLLFNLCNCKSTYQHIECLKKWIDTKHGIIASINNNYIYVGSYCEVCKHQFRIKNSVNIKKEYNYTAIINLILVILHYFILIGVTYSADDIDKMRSVCKIPYRNLYVEIFWGLIVYLFSLGLYNSLLMFIRKYYNYDVITKTNILRHMIYFYSSVNIIVIIAFSAYYKQLYWNVATGIVAINIADCILLGISICIYLSPIAKMFGRFCIRNTAKLYTKIKNIFINEIITEEILPEETLPE
jgi:hypothetical protein